MEEDDKIGFLDVLVRRNKEGFITKVHRKCTHTDLYTHYTSHYHPYVKSETVKCLSKRAEMVCDDTTIKEELSYLRETFKRNSYPDKIISQNLRRNPQPTSNTTEKTEKTKLLYIPYMKGLSKTIQGTCRNLNVKAVFKSDHTLRQLLTRVRPPISDMKRKEVVYRIPCMDCETVYIGKTRRSLEKRVSEHKYML